MTDRPSPQNLLRGADPRTHGGAADYGWYAQAFVLVQIACQLLLLLFASLGSLRVVFRTASFTCSLLFLVVLAGRRGPARKHPAVFPACAALVILGVSLLNPGAPTAEAAIAELALNAAILAPLFWVPRIGVNGRVFRRLLLTLGAFHILSCFVGMLQVLYPGRFMPQLSAVYQGQDMGMIDSLKIVLTSGEKVFRPMGLTDVPGGVSMSGMYAALLGTGFLILERDFLLKLIAAVSVGVGLFGIYLSQVRSALVITAVCMLTLLFILFRRGMLGHVLQLAVTLTVTVALSFTFAVAVGGKSVTERLNTLVEDDATSVYRSSRGRFLDVTLTYYLPRYPLGAGLGRWGMTNYYFGRTDDPERQPIWVEIQLTGWLFDGGVPLILAYGAAVLVSGFAAYRICVRSPSPTIARLAALVAAYDAGMVALTFCYPIFIGQGGMEFWLLNAGLFSAHVLQQRDGALRARRVAAAAPALRPTVTPTS